MTQGCSYVNLQVCNLGITNPGIMPTSLVLMADCKQQFPVTQ